MQIHIRTTFCIIPGVEFTVLASTFNLNWLQSPRCAVGRVGLEIHARHLVGICLKSILRLTLNFLKEQHENMYISITMQSSAKEFLAKSERISVARSAGTHLQPNSIACSMVYGSSTSGLFKTSICSLLCGVSIQMRRSSPEKRGFAAIVVYRVFLDKGYACLATADDAVRAFVFRSMPSSQMDRSVWMDS